MNKPSKCKKCQWYGKPYWSIINPCDNCPMEDVEVFTPWIDPTIKELKEENEKLKKQLEYLRSNEYLNQVKWERNFNEDLVKELQQRINEAIKLLEEDRYSASFNTTELLVIKLLKGEK